jgi:peptidoglycan LD-endopeptidase LytH
VPIPGRALRSLLLAGLCGVLGSCRSLPPPPTAPSTPAPRQEYLQSLARAGLSTRPLARDWVAAGHQAVAAAIGVTAPFRETGFFDPARPHAAAFAVLVRRGEQIDARVATAPADLPLFLELVRPGGGRGTAEPWQSVAAAPDGRSLRYRPRHDERLILLLQPELLAGGRYTLDLVVQGALLFPLAEPSRALAGRFGDPRDGGARRHQGIDVPAPRGTPALAADDGLVVRVGENPLGGKVVHLAAESGVMLYYAHLDRQLVREGQRVRRGQPVGLVGNTGNARSTVPHLHFEVISGGGAVDPEPWVRHPAAPAGVTAALAPLGDWQRIRHDGARLHAGPGHGYPAIADLPLHHPVAARAASGDWYRLELPDGRAGYTTAAALGELREPLRRLPLVAPLELRAGPSAVAPRLAQVPAGESVEVLAQAGETLLVLSPSGARGWADLP